GIPGDSQNHLYPFVRQIARPPPPSLFPYTTLFRSSRTRRRTTRARRPRPSPRARFPRRRPTTPTGRRRRAAASPGRRPPVGRERSEEHTSELQSLRHRVCRLLLEKKN